MTRDFQVAFRKIDQLGRVYSSVGNHDNSPTDAFAPKAVDTTQKSQWVLDALAKAWEPSMGQEAAEQVKDFGAYSTRTKEGLRIISINNILYYTVSASRLAMAVETDECRRISGRTRQRWKRILRGSLRGLSRSLRLLRPRGNASGC